MILLLAMACLRGDERDGDVTRAVRAGDIHDALSIGLTRLERACGAPDPNRWAALGQLMGQALLAAGREEHAEELFQSQLRLYRRLPRDQARWFSSMDRGCLLLSLNRLGRAAECFNVVADSKDAPAMLRVEALSGLGEAVQGIGERRRASRTLALAADLAVHVGPAWRQLIEVAGLELEMTSQLRRFEEPVMDMCRPAGSEMSARRLRTASAGLSATPLISRRLAFLAALADPAIESMAGVARMSDELNWWRDRRIGRVEEAARVEAALVLVDRGRAHAAIDVLGPLATDAARHRDHRHAMELAYCASSLHAMQGKHAEALRSFRQYAAQAMSRLRCELHRLPYSRFLERQERACEAGADFLRLPTRYRRAYQFMLDHLDESTLTIRRVAAHIEVTERALQMAFRTHLGLSPAELIRQLRMAGLRAELQQSPGRESIAAVAQRWGVAHRSTLARNYREHFDEAPTDTPPGLAWHEDAS